VKFNNYENICLFSGGIDSLSGIIESKKQLKNVCGIFIAHSDQAGTIKVVNNLMRSFLSPNGIDIKKIYAPPMKMMGYSQMRGFLYILSSSIYANIFQSKNIVVSECGPTMYQPKFGPFDSITLTSNPILIEKTKNIIETLLNREIKIILPFEDMTKAEVLMLMPKELMKDTFSCISQRFRIHDGVCYGCIIRRLAGIITGHNDAIYKYDVFGNGTSHVENLLSLLRFSYDMLFDISDTLPFAEYIEEYNKLDLFKRFAIDNLLALNILIESRYNFNKYVKNFLKNNEFPNNNFFEKRRKDILSNKLKPNFNI
jgi:7-cyano-7-deazaguanine synthase in queuosine biosynthesis